jgi:hypothetical protein
MLSNRSALDRRGSNGLYVQYGAGLTGPSEWVNFDASPTLWLERRWLIGRLISKNAARFSSNIQFGDIVKGLPIPPNTVDGLYASHVLEHLTQEDRLIALAHSYHLLKPGGTFRLVVPDLRARAELYISDHGSEHGASWFLRSSGLGRERRMSGLVGKLTQAFGHSAHLWMWDEASMSDALASAGFTRIRRCEFGDAEDAMFRLVEEEGRFLDQGIEELAMEARK